MRQTISAVVAAIAAMTISAMPAMACGGWGYGAGCAQSHFPVEDYGCYSRCGGGTFERLPDPVQQYHSTSPVLHQYYYVDQGPTYTGPGDFAPYPSYREGGVVYRYPRHVHGWRAHHRMHHGYRGHMTHRYD